MEMFVTLCVFAGLALLAAPYLRREWTWLRRAIIAFALLVFGRYLLWRVESLPALKVSSTSIGTYAFFVLELMAGYLWVLDVLCLKKTINRTAQVDRQLDWYGAKAPRVDVIVATYNEPWEVLEKTLVGATSIDYPNYQAWIFDDGNRAWLKEKAASLGVGYVTRTNNAHFKAGNLNHGVAELRAQGLQLEYLALMDADFIARPQFIRRTLALMLEKDVGIVQTPQVFYNPDPHQLAFGGIGAWPDEQRAWFDVYLPALDAHGWASCCGTSCLIRMASLDAIGGFPISSVCEDTLSSMQMAGKGMRTVFLQERLSVGLAPEGIGEFLTQRARWLLGGVQNTRIGGSGPGVRAKVDYWLRLWRNAVWGIMPLGWVGVAIVFWFTGVSLLPAKSFADAMTNFGPMYLDRFFRGWMFGGRQMFLISDAVWMLLAPIWVKQTFLAVLGLNSKFKVTDKAVHRDKGLIHWRILPVYATIAGLLIAGFLYNMTDSSAPGYKNGFFQTTTLMSAYFLLVIFAGTLPLFEAPRRRQADRYATDEIVTAVADGKEMQWRCRDISLGGALVELAGGANPPTWVDLQIAELGTVRAELTRVSAPGLAAFAFRSPELRPALVKKLYFTDRYIESPSEWSWLKSAAAIGRRLLF
jgi:cellulose synthase (UDP-forming)